MNQNKIQELIKEILLNIGENPQREGLLKTPERVAKSFSEIFSGYNDNPEDILSTTFSEDIDYDDFVALYDISFNSMCEHHMLPFSGVAHIAYIPNNKVVGLSKLARLVESHSRKLQIQEKMTNDIARDIENFLAPNGVIVVLQAHHSCMSCRGVKKQNSRMITKSSKGEFHKNNLLRQEFLSFIK
jgi:GTP cyclohydrolase I